MSIETYAIDHLDAEMKAIENSSRNNLLPELNIYEKAVIYKYSDNGFSQVNLELRKSKGKTFSEFATYLSAALANLNNYEGLVYRMVYLTPAELNRYKKAVTGKNIKEHAFISTTKSRSIAENFNGTTKYTPNCLFRIQCKTGKEIEKITKFAEQEVLIGPNTTFEVLDVKKEGGYTIITMSEI